MAIIQMPLQMRFGLPLLTFIIILPINALMLWVCGKIFREEITYEKALIPSVILGVLNYVIVISLSFTDNLVIIGILDIVIGLFGGITLYLILPTLIFKLSWGKGLLIGLTWFVFMFLASFITSPIIRFISLILGF